MVSEYVSFVIVTVVAHILHCCAVGNVGRWLVGGWEFLFQSITGKNVSIQAKDKLIVLIYEQFFVFIWQEYFV